MASDPVRVGRWWLWPDGVRLPVVSGGATGDVEGDDDPPADGSDTGGDVGDDDEPLGEAGKKALERERRARREAEARLREVEAKLEEHEGEKKSDVERATDRIATLERELAETRREALRLEVAMAKGLTAAQARRLAGNTREELEADADELLELFGGRTGGSSATGDDDRRPPRKRPTPDLRGGVDPTEPVEDTDPAKLAARIPRL